MGILTDLIQHLKGYNRNSMVLMGDSRLAGFFTDPSTKLRRSGANFLAMALRLSGQRMRVERSFAVSGQRSDQYLTPENVVQALACNSYWLVIYGVANDIGTYGDAVDHFTANIKPVADAWTATGRGVILITETGANTYASSAANMGAVFRYNRQVRDYCRANRGAILFDAAAVVMDPSQPMALNPAHSGDGLHIGLMAGAHALGSKFADLIKQIAPPCDGLVYSAGQVFANGGAQLHPNPLWLTTTGGSGYSGGGTSGTQYMTGTVPLGISKVTAPAGSSIVGSVVAGPYGNDLQLAITAGAAGEVRIVYDFPAEQEIVGETYYANCEYDVAAGATSFQIAGAYLEANRAGVTTVTQDGITDPSSVALPSGNYTFVSETEGLTIASGARGWFSFRFVTYFSAAGSATLNLRRFGVWHRQ
ncbi:SGNH/GDSL hydrolase family protein [Xanthobacter autotrophicus]|uniref:SGNH/GDSL hydrolase family protein n=1 Tax=Xanthobacter TaxID=279 RepID=UPI0024AADA76|nr:SGNH/GDSL hydrolase family protein [Xanthobacter autotrophicus]MDI4664727.1 SGNH/GDSL hydrolase family protein [Xanthobacter autotrophicus]